MQPLFPLFCSLFIIALCNRCWHLFSLLSQVGPSICVMQRPQAPQSTIWYHANVAKVATLETPKT